MSLVFKDKIPPGLFNANVTDLHSVLGGPSLFFIEGARKPALILSTLLHGNEHTGFLALKSWLRPYALGSKPIPRSLWVFIGNTEAAQLNLRLLPGRVDYNRLWRGSLAPEAKIAAEVMARVTKDPLFAAVDIHNNSGNNPHYACVAKWERSHIELGGLFGRTLVHATQPAETFTHAFADFSPSVTLECGLSGNERSTQHTIDYLESVLHLSHFSPHAVSQGDIDGYETVARVRVKPGVAFEFADLDSSVMDKSYLVLRSDLERLNFSPLPAGTLFGRYTGDETPIEVLNGKGEDPKLLSFDKGRIFTTETITPAMLTTNVQAVRDDCLGYLMNGKKLPDR